MSVVTVRRGLAAMCVIGLCSPTSTSAAIQHQAVAVCPDETDTPRIIEHRIVPAYRAFAQGTGDALTVCFVTAVAKKHKSYADSVISMTVAMSDALIAKHPDDTENLAARLVLLARVRRYPDVSRTFDRLVSLDPTTATLANYRLALAGAQQAGDTATRLRYLTRAAKRFPNASSIVADYNIQRQTGRLRALIDTTRRIMRRDSANAAGYASLASIFGNLDMPDSALSYTRLALARGMPRSQVAPSLQSLIGVSMRKAQLHDRADVWASTLPLARRIDSTISTDASKHLIGLALWELAVISTDSLKRAFAGGGIDVYGTVTLPPIALKSACAIRQRAVALVDEALTWFTAGGSRFGAENLGAIQGGIGEMRREHASHSQRCAG